MSSQPPWAVVRCANEVCPVFGVVRRLRLEPAGPGFVRVPALRCVRCGHAAQDVPHGGGDMPKITVHGGASVAAVGESGPEPVTLPAGAEVVAAVPPAVPEPAEPVAADEPDGDQDDVETLDPGAHTVIEVNAYLESAADAERARVLAAEQAGKARLGILNTWGTP